MQELLTIGIIGLVFALIVAIFIPLMKKMNQHGQLQYELHRDGVPAQGYVTGRYEDVVDTRSRYGGSKTTYYKVKYTYLYDGVSYQNESVESESDYETYREGSEISVICHPRHPELAYRLRLIRQAPKIEPLFSEEED